MTLFYNFKVSELSAGNRQRAKMNELKIVQVYKKKRKCVKGLVVKRRTLKAVYTKLIQ